MHALTSGWLPVCFSAVGVALLVFSARCPKQQKRGARENDWHR